MEERGKDFNAHLVTNPTTGEAIGEDDIAAVHNEEGQEDGHEERTSDISYTDEDKRVEQIEVK
jgi:hypothetical protein